ncbi:secretory protein [Fulvivirga sp. M361]|uniref:basic secretory protein-like protein n=1 Tax=Fulvivirga sp. M361 TaxID=2594266 RepID=UPI00117A1776|nr:basic secretory protein-like protein [Fulvivirga sp. M361]TRX59147.1 secretory protein [Fulvivirga sp. M361]
MKNNKNVLLATTILLSFIIVSFTFMEDSDEVYKRKGYTLTVINKATGLDGDVKNDLVETFFTVYPVLARSYNQNTVKEVEFFIDPDYKGVAEAGGGRVRISPHWLKEHPTDFDLVTHEVMHLVQSYPGNSGPWWVTEGIADYVRYVNGCDNARGGWSLPDYSPEQNYDNSYRVTARFFLWIENKVSPGFVKRLDHAMRSKSYSEKIWVKLTGKNVDDLWKQYSKDPSI